MNENLKDKTINYSINSNSDFALLEFKNSFLSLIEKYSYKKIIFLCIGTDRVMGDCLGPLIGYKLSKLPLPKNVIILGDLENPVHAKNLNKHINWIYENEKNSLVVAIDASLGKEKCINHINLGEGSIKPGAGVKKNLPYVGDLYITGVVSTVGLLKITDLQNTRLSIIMKMADIISTGVWHCLNLLYDKFYNSF